MRVTISPDDVGRRVSVRSSQTDPTDSRTMTDAVGHLIAWEDGMLHIRRRDDTIVVVAEQALLAGKVLPDAPPRRRSERYPR